MATTPVLALRYPIDTDTPVVVHTAIQNLASDFDAFFGAWTGWTPQIDQGATTNIAKTVNVARYRLVGKFCEFEMKLTLTAAGTSGSPITFTLPQTSKFAGYWPVARGTFNDVSAVATRDRTVFVNTGSTTKAVYAVPGIGGSSSEYVIALASGDILTAVGFMEVA